MRVCLVTGGSSGIGRASAVKFAECGFNVVIADVDEAGAQETCRMIQDLHLGVETVFIRTDVSQEAHVKALVDSISSRFGRLDCCINNAGIEGDRAPTHEYNTATFDRVMAVNVRGVWLCVKYEVPLMLQTIKQHDGTEGSIVITSSTAGLQGMPEFGPYAASKHALVGIARSAAAEYASSKLRVNCINPASTDTPMVKRFTEQWPEWQAATNASYPLKRIATAQEVADAALWVATRATFMTGQTLVLDGGAMCHS